MSFVKFLKISWSSQLLKIKVNLFVSKISKGSDFVFGMSRGGGNNGSTAIFNAFSTILGMILASRGELNYRQGLVFTSINHVAKSSSIMKSNPKI